MSSVFQPNPPISGFDAIELSAESEEIYETLNITTAELSEIIKDILPKKSPGYDKITPLRIKNLPDSALTFLVKVFNSMLLIGFFPEFWKISEINFIHDEIVGKDTHNYIYIWQTDVKNKDYLQFPAHNPLIQIKHLINLQNT